MGISNIFKNNRVPEWKREVRLYTCTQCPKLFRPTMQCKECGCFVKAKVKYEEENCPKGKW
ncbi:MAG: DUF6171 family protein [Bacteroidota bacterium]